MGPSAGTSTSRGSPSLPRAASGSPPRGARPRAARAQRHPAGRRRRRRAGAVGLPEKLLAAGLTSSGFEGVAVTGDRTSEHVYAVTQREWTSDAVGAVKIARYEVATGEWTFVSYALDAVESPAGGWVGLSELTLAPEGTFVVLERDDRAGTAARITRPYRVGLAAADFRPFVAGTALSVVGKELVGDLLGPLAAASVWTPDTLEGLGIAADGEVFAVTDNDGLDDAVGQTVLLRLGNVDQAG